MSLWDGRRSELRTGAMMCPIDLCRGRKFLTWSHGWLLSGHNTQANRTRNHPWNVLRKDFHDRTNQDYINRRFKACCACETRIASEWYCRRDSCNTDCALHPFARGSRAKDRLRVVVISGRTGKVPRGSDSSGYLSKSGSESLGWRNRGYCVLGSKCGRSEFPGFCHQLRSPWLSRPLVPAVEPFYVPLPRRSLLSGWFPRFGSSAPRTFHVPLQD